MKGDFSRRTFDPRKHYSAVLQEQGRLLTDADLEEEHRILSNAHERAAADIIGGCGGPIGEAGFAVSSPDGVRLALSAGRYYAAGKLVVNEETVDYTEQPDRFEDDIVWPPPPGRYAIVLDVWRRFITALDDPSIREVALGGPTTSGRERTVWQARHRAVPANWTCADPLPAARTTTGAMAARAEPEASTTTPCLVPPLAGYTGLENQFYRVEVLTPGAALDVATAVPLAVVDFPAGTTNQVELSAADAGGLSPGDVVEVVRTGIGTDPMDATFAQVADVSGTVVTLTSRLPEFGPTDTAVLRASNASVVISRENGSVVTAIEQIDGLEVTVAGLGSDEVLGFAPGQWVELSDDLIELEHHPRQLRQIEAIDTDRLVVTLRTAADPLAVTASGVLPERHPKLRRWDGARAIAFQADGTGWIHVENGIQVRFTAGAYISGDYWDFPARAATVDEETGNIEWPRAGTAAAELPPFGVRHHFCKLAVVDVTVVGGAPHVEVDLDCRDLFPPLTGLTTLLHVGGDGQEARPQAPGFPQLPAPLTVRVANGGFPVPGARVLFTGQGQLIPAAAVTDANGLLTCAWRLNPGIPAQSCVAQLLDAGGNPIPHQVVRFHATIDLGGGSGGGEHRSCCVCVGPGGDFETIEEAISSLLDQGERDLCLCLMVGDHPVGQLELPVPDLEGPPFHLSIKGCGRLSRVRVEGGMLIDGWRSVRLVDLNLLLSREAVCHTRGVAEVRIDNVHANGSARGVGLIRIHDASAVYVGSSVIRTRGRGSGRDLRELFAELPALEAAWDRIDEADFDLIVRSATTELAAMGVDERRRGAAIMVRKARARDRRLSSGFLAGLDRLAGRLSAERPSSGLAQDIFTLVAALAAGSDFVALEIGSGDEQQEDMADPASTTFAEIIVEDNEISGGISLYGLAGGEALNVDERERLEGRLKEGGALGGLAGTVHLRDNRFGRLLLSAGMLEALRRFALGEGPEQLLTAYETLLATNNVVDGAESQSLAQHTVLTSNEFTLAAIDDPVPPLVVLHLVADTGIATGNHGDALVVAGGAAQPVRVEETTRAFTEAANLELDFI
ncbi:DUF6519 domain-containing protein [Micromonospora sp. DT81.3]|uniref:DUF6519 domain-containing protein n=1 Tax=Micromonospora sp. DT81.3 TaxID=3416523 RepID=UPI003CF767E1